MVPGRTSATSLVVPRWTSATWHSSFIALVSTLLYSALWRRGYCDSPVVQSPHQFWNLLLAAARKGKLLNLTCLIDHRHLSQAECDSNVFRTFNICRHQAVYAAVMTSCRNHPFYKMSWLAWHLISLYKCQSELIFFFSGPTTFNTTPSFNFSSSTQPNSVFQFGAKPVSSCSCVFMF